MFKDSLIKFLKLENLIGNLTGYIETRVALIKIEVQEDLVKGLSKLIPYILMFLVSGIVILFLSVALAIQIGLYWGLTVGFCAVGCFYLLIALLLFIFRQHIRYTSEKKITHLLNKNPE